MIRQATPEDLPAILDIYNEAIRTSTAVYRYAEQTLEEKRAWYEQARASGFPVIVFAEDGIVAGFGTFGRFRAYEGYRYTVEHSVYVHPLYQGRRIGAALLGALIDTAGEQGYAVMIAAIDAANAPSRRLHETFGFLHAGTLHGVGWKFGRWLDVALYEKRLREDAPEAR